MREWNDRILWLILLLAAVLLLTNLGTQCLWQDEAETGLLARSILQNGVPIASDGTNIISQELGREFGPDHVWRWSPWIQFYVAAGGLKIFGDSAFSARLPFALLGIAAIALTYSLSLRISNSIKTARLSALVLSTSVWFLLHARQARWYAIAYVLATLILIAVLEIERSTWGAIFVAASVALFYTNYFIAIAFVMAAVIALPVLHRDPRVWKRITIALGVIAGLTLPGLFYFDLFGRTGLIAPNHLARFLSYALRLLIFVIPFPMVFIAAWWNRMAGVRFLCILSFVFCILLASGPTMMFRYSTVLFPVGAVLSSLALESISNRSISLAIAVGACLIFTSTIGKLPFGYLGIDIVRSADDRLSPFFGYIGDLISVPASSDCAAAQYLKEHGSSGETVLTTYGDLPLQFYTKGFRIVGGLKGGELPKNPDWIVRHAYYVNPDAGRDLTVMQFIDSDIDLRRYRQVFTVSDPRTVPYGEPFYHQFGASDNAGHLKVFRRND